MKMRTYGMVPIALFILLRMGEAYAETEPAEITIHILGGHKAVISALLEAVDGGTPVTGIAALDSLAATYGLIGIYRKDRISPFYGYRFRLTFPPGEDVAAMAGAYWILPYIQSVEPEPPPEVRARKSLRGIHVLGGGEHAVVRIPTKVVCGTLSGVVFTAIGVAAIVNGDESSGSAGSPILFGMLTGSAVGFARWRAERGRSL